MSRPPVSVVVPFAGTGREAQETVALLGRLELKPGDEIIVADNSGCAAVSDTGGIRVVSTGPERSSYHARNCGAAAAAHEWLLFIDSDCQPAGDLIDRYFDTPPRPEEGALSGKVLPDPEQQGIVPRYIASRGYLDQDQLFADAFRPHAVTANLCVRTSAFRDVGGFCEGIRSGGDTEFSWRLQQAGWSLGRRPDAIVTHRHRETLRAFVRVTARYAAGRAWLRRRYPGSFAGRPGARASLRAVFGGARWLIAGQLERGIFRLFDALTGAVDLTAERLPNRPSGTATAGIGLVILTDSYPTLSETFISAEVRALRAAGHTVRVEALRRPLRQDLLELGQVPVSYAEDLSAVEKLAGVLWLVSRHPVRCANDLRRRGELSEHEPVAPLRALSGLAWRLRRDPAARLHCHFAAEAALWALRTSTILDRPYSLTAHAYEIFREPRNLEVKLDGAALVTTGCKYNVEYLRARTRHPERVHEIVMGVDGERFRRRTKPAESRNAVAVGRLVEKKGFNYLIQAASLTTAEQLCCLTIVGDGPERPELEQQIVRLGVEGRVLLAGAQDHEAVRRHIEAADVLVMPCVIAADGDRDSMPVVVKEALALEVPVVGTDEVGLPELIQPRWGMLVPSRNPAALADAIVAIIARPADERRAMGAAGRAHVLEHCELHRETAKLARLLQL